MTNLASVQPAGAETTPRSRPGDGRLREYPFEAASANGYLVGTSLVRLIHGEDDEPQLLVVPRSGDVADFDEYRAMLAEDPASLPTPTVAWLGLADRRRRPVAILLALGRLGLPRPVTLAIGLNDAIVLWAIKLDVPVVIPLDADAPLDGPVWDLGPNLNVDRLEEVLRRCAVPSHI